MNIEQNEKRLMEAFTQYESGESLATLQTLYSDVAVELNQMVEAERMLEEGKIMMRSTNELGRKVVAALAQQQRRNESSIFMSKLWRFAAPVGVAALSFMFVIASQHTAQLAPVVTELAQDAGALRLTAPMMAKNSELSLMTAPAPEADSSFIANVNPAAEAPQIDWLFIWQMSALGLLTILSTVVFFKHRQVRGR